MSSGIQGEAADLPGLALLQESVRNTALVENLDRARQEAERALTHEILILPPLHDRDVNPCQRQFPRQHETRWTRPHNDHLMSRHVRIHAADSPARPGPCRKPHGPRYGGNAKSRGTKASRGPGSQGLTVDAKARISLGRTKGSPCDGLHSLSSGWS